MPQFAEKLEIDLVERVLFEDLNLVEGLRFFVGFSGGKDSTVLIQLMSDLRHQRSLDLTALHLDHGIHEESIRWQQHCVDVCASLDIPIVSNRIQVESDPSIGVEASLRNARYRWMQSVMSEEPAYLLIAHHRQDQAETFLLNLLWGSGVDGLTACQKTNPLGDHTLVRPLLDVTPGEIDTYARDKNLKWVDDPSNLDTRYRRNKIRKNIIPALTDVKQDALSRISASIENLQASRDLLNEIAQEDLEKLPQSAYCPLDGSSGLDVSSVGTWSSVRFINTLRYWLRGLGYAAPDRRLLLQLDRWRISPAPVTAILGKGGVEYRNYRGILYVMRRLEERPQIQERSWEDISTPLNMPEIGVSLSCNPTLDAPVPGGGLEVRGRTGGERVKSPSGGLSHDLKKLYQDRDVAPWLRFRIPLIYRNGDIVAIPGVGQYGCLEKFGRGGALICIEALPDNGFEA
jgi:tRNA(Ile)-lysidine synthase